MDERKPLPYAQGISSSCASVISSLASMAGRRVVAGPRPSAARATAASARDATQEGH